MPVIGLTTIDHIRGLAGTTRAEWPESLRSRSIATILTTLTTHDARSALVMMTLRAGKGVYRLAD